MTSAGHVRPIVIETARLVLREIDDRDAAFIAELLNDPDFVANIGDRGVRTPADARAYIRKGPAASYARHGFGLWLVQRKDGGTPIGICGLLKRDALDDVDIGFAYLPLYRRAGYAFEAAAAVLEYARTVLGLPRVVAIVSVGNTASVALLRRLGFSFERIVQVADEGPPLELFAIEQRP